MVLRLGNNMAIYILYRVAHTSPVFRGHARFCQSARALGTIRIAVLMLTIKSSKVIPVSQLDHLQVRFLPSFLPMRRTYLTGTMIISVPIVPGHNMSASSNLQMYN